MASIEGPADGDSFPAVNATRELNLGVPEEFPVDPISADVEKAKQVYCILFNYLRFSQEFLAYFILCSIGISSIFISRFNDLYFIYCWF